MNGRKLQKFVICTFEEFVYYQKASLSIKVSESGLTI